MVFGGSVQADHRTGLEDCLLAVKAIRAGDFVKVEYLGFADEGGAAYEIELRDPDGKEWEFECSASTAKIIEIEQEVDSASHELFKRQAKVSEDDARKIALSLYPGEIEEVEYEIEANGAASYEFDIVDKYGVEFKVEVDAKTGDIVEVQIEQWEIGEEDTVGKR
jgi:uncharacterized membrane protein YkoI